jgi:two-component system response regulator
MFTHPNARLLLVEDDPHDLELMHLALAQCPFARQIDTVDDGEDALHYLLADANPRRPLPRLVLLDLKLPKVSGIEVLSAIRHHPRTQNLVVVVMTASTDHADLEACYHLGVNSYVIKPQDREQFQAWSRQVTVYWMQLNQLSWA